MTQLTDTGQHLPVWRTGRWWHLVGSSAAGIWVSVGLGFFGTVLVARSLGPNSYAGVTLAAAVVATVTAILDIPLGDAVVHYGYRARVAGADRSRRRILRRAVAADILVGSAIAGLRRAIAAPAARAAPGA